MSATSSLSPEQKPVLGTVFNYLEGSSIYLQCALPIVSGADEQLLKELVELGLICMKRLPQSFPELQPLAEEWKKREGAQ